MKLRIRKGGFTQDFYLNRKGNWVRWQDAAVFHSQTAADRFAEHYEITDYGLF